MRDGLHVIDSDLHWIEPADLWERYLDEEFRDRGPRSIVTAEGERRYMLDGRVVRSWLNDSAIVRVNEALGRERGQLAARIVERAGEPAAYKEPMDVEGIDVAVMFRSLASMFVSDDDTDPRLAAAIARAFNDWAADFCRADPRRFKGTAIVSQHDPEAAACEVRRAVEELGLVGVALLPMPIAGRHVHDPAFDVLWAELERLDVPACFHGTSSALSRDYLGARLAGHPSYRTISHASTFTLELMLAAASMILGGVLQRFPGLRVALLEGNCSWVPWWLYRLDDQSEKYGPGEPIRLDARPSEFFVRQCFVSVDPDEHLVRHVIEEVGDDNLVFSTDIPHNDGAYPDAVTQLLTMDVLTQESKRKILWDNCAKLYGIDEPGTVGPSPPSP